jgi:hypothetical protein
MLPVDKQEEILFSDYAIIQSELTSSSPKEHLNLHGVEWFYDKKTRTYTGKKQ